MSFINQDLRLAILHSFEDFLTVLENIKLKEKCEKFTSCQEAAMLCNITSMQLVKRLNERLQKLVTTDDYFQFQEVLIIAGSQKYFSVEQLLIAFDTLCRVSYSICAKLQLKNEAIRGIIPENTSEPYVQIEIINETNFKVNFLRGITSKFQEINRNAAYIDCVSKMWNFISNQERQPSPDEFLALQLAYQLLISDPVAHCSLGLNYKSLGTPGFRKNNQTFMSLTDPGEGHLYGTTRKGRWLQDVYVHVEHLERPNNLPRCDIESYRVPSSRNFAKVRLHTNSRVPNTFYMGRILHDAGHFERDLLRVVRIFSSAMNSAFSKGTAECKLSMDNMSTYEAVKFMRTLKAEVVKNEDQVISAAWNLNSELVEDVELKEDGEICRKQQGKVYTDRFQIGRVAILMTLLGGFEKLTWDGASDTYPSKCIIPYQLSLSQAFTLVHQAHSVGLLTYMSAGFKFDEIKVAVFTGVDGVGIGGAQILRYMDEKTGFHGPYLEENIDGILHKRNEASQSQYGKAVKLLCKLDTMFNEGSITLEENDLRERLFKELNVRFQKYKPDSNIKEYEALIHEKNKSISDIMNQLESVESIEIDETISKGKAIADRILRTDNPILYNYSDSNEKLTEVKEDLTTMFQKNSEIVGRFYDQCPWSCFFKKHKEVIVQDLVNSIFHKNDSIKYKFDGQLLSYKHNF